MRVRKVNSATIAMSNRQVHWMTHNLSTLACLVSVAKKSKQMRFSMRVQLWQIAANKSRVGKKYFTHKLVGEERAKDLEELFVPSAPHKTNI